MDFFTEYRDANRYKDLEFLGKGSYGVVCAATDTKTGERVAIKKIKHVFANATVSTRTLREIKLLRLLRHPNIVEIKGILLPPSSRAFNEIYVVFELMEFDLHRVIGSKNNLHHGHHRAFLFQMLRALKFVHSGMNTSDSNVFYLLVLYLFDPI